MKRPLIVANWKLYVSAREDALAKAKVIARVAPKLSTDLVVCPPALFIEAMSKPLLRAKVALGAQTVSTPGAQARTGEMTAGMVASVGARYVIVGHSERRAMGESDETVREQLQSALDAKLYPILCIGEHTRDAASGDYFGVIETQLRAALTKITPKEAGRIVVAYEPIWAIGKSAADAMARGELEETTLFIRKILADVMGRTAALKAPILYGGSVEAGNAEDLMKSGVAGFLVGHASVEPTSLTAVVRAAAGTNHGTKKR